MRAQRMRIPNGNNAKLMQHARINPFRRDAGIVVPIEGSGSVSGDQTQATITFSGVVPENSDMSISGIEVDTFAFPETITPVLTGQSAVDVATAAQAALDGLADSVGGAITLSAIRISNLVRLTASGGTNNLFTSAPVVAFTPSVRIEGPFEAVGITYWLRGTRSAPEIGFNIDSDEDPDVWLDATTRPRGVSRSAWDAIRAKIEEVLGD